MKNLIVVCLLLLVGLGGFAQGKTVYVSTEEVFSKIPQTKNADSLVNKEAARLSALYDDRKTELNDLVSLFVKDSVTMTADKKELKRKSLQEKYTGLSNYEQELKAALEDYKEKQLDPIRAKIIDNIKVIAKAKAATTVLYRESAVIIPTGSDITLDVIKKMGGK